MTTEKTWRFALRRGRKSLPFEGQIDWEGKRIAIRHPTIAFVKGARYKVIFIDPTLPKTLVRATLRPLKLTCEEGKLVEVVCEFFHRKD